MTKKNNNNKSLKKYKEKIDEYFNAKDYENVFLLATKIIDKYPKNYYGYLSIIRAKTNDYSIYINDDEIIRELKNNFEKVKEYTSKKEKEKFKKEFDEYILDCKEVENLKKVRKEITSKELIKQIYENSITFINRNIMSANSYKVDGTKIKNIYDLINGIFFVICLIYNLIYRNYLLTITIPFGIFGIINIYSFLDMNFLKKGSTKSEKKMVKKLIELSNKRIEFLKEQISKSNENLSFLYEQKSSIILKIPASFEMQIKDILINDEKEEAQKIFNQLLEKDIFSFTTELNLKTNIDANDIEKLIKEDLKKEDDELLKFINTKLAERKNKQNELVYIKKISLFSIILTIALFFLSILNIVYLINNFYEINYISFIMAFIVGIISSLIYNVDSGKHKSFFDTSNDNLLLCVFKSTLTYDLIYFSITNELKLTYGFMQMPLIFILIFIGIVMLISILKYNYYFKKITRS